MNRKPIWILLWTASIAIVAPGRVGADNDAMGYYHVDGPLPVFQAPDIAADAAAVALSNFKTAANHVRDLDKQLGDLKAKAKAAEAKRARLVAGKPAYMDEIRRGEYCSGCGRTKSDILSHGEEFPHPGQHIVIPTQEELAAKERDYDAKIAEATQEAASADAQLKQAEGQRAAGLETLRQNMMLWKDATRQEGPLMLAEFNGKKTQLESQMADWKKQIDNFNRLEAQALHPAGIGAPGAAVAPANVAQAKELETEKNGFIGMMRGDMNQLESLGLLYGQKKDEFLRQANAGRESFDGDSKLLGMISMPAWTASELNFKAGDFSISLGRDKIGASFSVGPLGVDFNGSSDFFNSSTSIAAAMSLSAGPVSVSAGIKQTTNGATQTGTPTGDATFLGHSVKEMMTGGTADAK